MTGATFVAGGESWRESGAGARGGRRLSGAIVVSAVLHAAVVAALLVVRNAAPVSLPPVYRVNLVAAPPGPRAIGTVTPAPATPAPAPTPNETPKAKPAPTPSPPVAKAPPKAKALPNAPKTRPAPKQATPTPPTAAAARPKPATSAAAPRAGGGPEGGAGADVANVKTNGLDFPYPGYLENIVRQIALRFSPSNRTRALSADVSFLIHRDGSVSEMRLVRRSGNYEFDLEAQGAVEAVNKARAFGPLPSGFPADVLPVTFSFDPRVIR